MRSLLVIPGSSGLVVPQVDGISGAPGGVVLPFRFPFSCFVSGLLVVPAADDVEAAAAALGLSVVDETADLLISDGRGTLVVGAGPLQTFAADASPFLLSGSGFHPSPLQRPISAGDQWFFTLSSRAAADLTLGAIVLYVEPPS